MTKKDFPKGSHRSIGSQKYKNDQRPGARPPDAWDDKPFGRESRAPCRHAARMKDLGISKGEASKRLEKKWKLSKTSIVEILNQVWDS